MNDILDELMKPVDMDRHALATVIVTCQEMILLAQKGDWERVSYLEQRRIRELTDYFSRPVDPQEALGLAESIARISELNEMLVDMATTARQHLVHEAKTSRQQNLAARAYHSIAGRV